MSDKKCKNIQHLCESDITLMDEAYEPRRCAIRNKDGVLVRD